MIQLTRLNNHPLVVNSDLIKFVEQAPDTVITLVSGEKIVVREKAIDVLERVVLFRRAVLQGIAICSALPTINAPAAPADQPADQGRSTTLPVAEASALGATNKPADLPTHGPADKRSVSG